MYHWASFASVAIVAFLPVVSYHKVMIVMFMRLMIIIITKITDHFIIIIIIIAIIIIFHSRYGAIRENNFNPYHRLRMEFVKFFNHD